MDTLDTGNSLSTDATISLFGRTVDFTSFWAVLHADCAAAEYPRVATLLNKGVLLAVHAISIKLILQLFFFKYFLVKIIALENISVVYLSGKWCVHFDITR
jgi:hypothetical protein